MSVQIWLEAFTTGRLQGISEDTVHFYARQLAGAGREAWREAQRIEAHGPEREDADWLATYSAYCD